VLVPDVVRLAGRLEPLASVLADRLQHGEARVRVAALRLAQEALAHQRRQHVQHGQRTGARQVAHGLRRIQRATAGEHGQSAEEYPLFRLQQVVAPVDGPPQRLLTHGGVARSSRQHR
jgi:hypothetical protein